MAIELPTPNARKTCALSIWLLQMQRLPSEVLVPAAESITCALQRGIGGELGKEGKRGSICDGLKVRCDYMRMLQFLISMVFEGDTRPCDVSAFYIHPCVCHDNAINSE
jgi:hypothetical protein